LMGMGLPTVGVYLLLSTLAAPPLIELGLSPMSAHLFVLYFGMLSMLTPPVAIAAFVAANMANAPPMRTGLEAVRVAWPAFLVPFLFVLSPALLFDGPGWQVLATVLTALGGVYLITAGIVGFAFVPLNPVWRCFFLMVGLAAFWPVKSTLFGAISVVGLALGVAGLALLRRRERAREPAPTRAFGSESG
ncbi:MAG: TRAP transporter large permease subunit, partial [Pseudomonadota bacterium]